MSTASTNKKVFADTKKGRRIKTKEFPNGFCHLNTLIFVSKWIVAKLWQKIASQRVGNYYRFWKIVRNISKEVKKVFLMSEIFSAKIEMQLWSKEQMNFKKFQYSLTAAQK